MWGPMWGRDSDMTTWMYARKDISFQGLYIDCEVSRWMPRKELPRRGALGRRRKKKTSGAHDMDAKNVYHLGSATFFDKTVLMKSWRRESQSMSHVRLTVREEQGHCNQLMKKKKGTFWLAFWKLQIWVFPLVVKKTKPKCVLRRGPSLSCPPRQRERANDFKIPSEIWNQIVKQLIDSFPNEWCC